MKEIGGGGLPFYEASRQKVTKETVNGIISWR